MNATDPRVYLDDLRLGADFSCGRFALARDEIVAFAEKFDPQPFHLDEAAGTESYFGGLVASGLHTQAAAIGLMVRAIADVAVVAGYALGEARFFIPVRPDAPHDVRARWLDATPSPRHPNRGAARIAIEVTDAAGRAVASFGVTYIVARHTD